MAMLSTPMLFPSYFHQDGNKQVPDLLDIIGDNNIPASCIDELYFKDAQATYDDVTDENIVDWILNYDVTGGHLENKQSNKSMARATSSQSTANTTRNIQQFSNHGRRGKRFPVAMLRQMRRAQFTRESRDRNNNRHVASTRSKAKTAIKTKNGGGQVKEQRPTTGRNATRMPRKKIKVECSDIVKRIVKEICEECTGATTVENDVGKSLEESDPAKVEASTVVREDVSIKRDDAEGVKGIVSKDDMENQICSTTSLATATPKPTSTVDDGGSTISRGVDNGRCYRLRNRVVRLVDEQTLLKSAGARSRLKRSAPGPRDLRNYTAEE